MHSSWSILGCANNVRGTWQLAKQWKDVKAAEVVAEAAVAAISDCSCSSSGAGNWRTSLQQEVHKTALTKPSFDLVGVIPKYALAEVDAEIIRQCAERTTEPVDSVVLDWKGIKSEHKNLEIIAALEILDLASEKV